MTEPAAMTSDACLIIPMYNEAAVIDGVVRRAKTAFHDVICVDDGSSDGTAAIARAAGADVVRHPRNLGQGAALQTGLSYALKTSRSRWFVTFDADGQHLVEDAMRLVAQATASGADVVLGSRFLGDGSHIPAVRRLMLLAGVLFTRVTTRLPVTDTHNGLRVFNRRAAECIQIRLPGMAHASEILHQIPRLGLKCEEAAVSIQYTEYSIGKGQNSLNALNVLFDLFLQKMRANL